MARNKDVGKDKTIRDEMLRLLSERVNNPTVHWLRSRAKSDDELFAGQLLSPDPPKGCSHVGQRRDKRQGKET